MPAGFFLFSKYGCYTIHPRLNGLACHSRVDGSLYYSLKILEPIFLPIRLNLQEAIPPLISEFTMAFPADDRFMRFTFADTKRVAGLLREFLPKKLLASLDLEHIKRIHDQAITTDLHEIRDDLNLECPMIPHGKVFIRILVEHKSYHDPHLWLQLMKSITTMWEQNGMAPVIPVVVHTGPETFRFEEPHTTVRAMNKALSDMFPKLSIIPIDLSACSEMRIWKSPVLDYVAKVALSILRLSQQDELGIANLRKHIRKDWPNCSPYRQRRYINAAISYLHMKNPGTTKAIVDLGATMRFAHPINPKSPFAQELREEFAKGKTEGLEQGIALNKIAIVQALLADGCDWKLIQNATQLDQAGFEDLKKKFS